MGHYRVIGERTASKLARGDVIRHRGAYHHIMWIDLDERVIVLQDGIERGIPSLNTEFRVYRWFDG